MMKGKPMANRKQRLRSVRVVQLVHASGLPLPQYATEAAAGLDLVAAVAADAPLTLAPGRWALIPTGLSIELPGGYEAQIRPRSGLALKHGITVLNSPGTIDADYRGEVQVMLINHGRAPFVVARGERIAQMVVAAVVQVRLAPVKNLGATSRGTGGFGSTGVASAENAARRGAAKARNKKKTAASAGPAKKSASARRSR